VSTGAKVQFERFETVQLSVHIDCNLAERVMMKVERILIAATVIGSIVDDSHDQSDRQLTREQLLVTSIEITGRYGERLTYDASDWIFGQGFCERQVDGRTDFAFANR
jgi:hypothetical protein